MFSKTEKENIIRKIKDEVLIASRDGKLKILQELLGQVKKYNININDIYNSMGNTPLHMAVIKGHIDIVQYLVDNDADIYRTNNIGGNSFYEALLLVPPRTIENKDSKQLLKNFKAIVQIFLAKGFNLNHTNKQSKSYLGFLALTGALDAMKILVACGASIDIKDQFDFTPLHCACIKGHFYNEQQQVVQWLIENNADLNVKTYEGKTPLGLAISSKHWKVKDLLQNDKHENSNSNNFISNL